MSDRTVDVSISFFLIEVDGSCIPRTNNIQFQHSAPHKSMKVAIDSQDSYHSFWLGFRLPVRDSGYQR